MARNAVEILVSVRDEATRQLRSIRQSTQREWESLSVASGVALRAFTAFGVAAAGAGTQMVRMAGQLEQSEIAFETLLGSAEAAGSYLEDLADFAARTPFDFVGVQNATRLMLAFGFEAEQALPIIETLGDSVSALGGSTAELEGVARALGQIETKGKVSQEELLQLAERGIPVFQILREELGLTQEEMGKIGELGISASEGITAILTGLQERFAGAMQKQSQSLLGLWSTIKDQGSLIMMDLGNSIVEALDLKGVLQRAVDWLEDFRQRVKDLDLRQMFLDNRDAVVAMAGAVTAMLLPSLINMALAVGRILLPLAALATAGALVADVARQLGVDFGDLIKPGGIVARLAQGFMGLVDVFRGVSTSIASLIRAVAQSVRDWLTFFRLAGDELGDFFEHLGGIAESLVGALESARAGYSEQAAALLEQAGELAGRIPRPDIAGAWREAFQGLDEDILTGFEEAQGHLSSGWEKLVGAVTGNVSETTNQMVTTVTNTVGEAVGKLTDFGALLGTDVTSGLEDVGSAADVTTEKVRTLSAEVASALPTVTDMAAQLGRAIGDAISDALGIDQPESPLVSIGRGIVEGIWAGINERLPSLAERLQAGWQNITADPQMYQEMLAATAPTLRVPGAPLETGPDPLGIREPTRLAIEEWGDYLQRETARLYRTLRDGLPTEPDPVDPERSRARTDLYRSIQRLTDAMLGRVAPQGNRTRWFDQPSIGNVGGFNLPFEVVIPDPAVQSFVTAAVELVEPELQASVGQVVSLIPPAVEAVVAGAVDVTGALEGMTATVEQNDAAMRVIYERERKAREEQVRQLTTWTAEKGPLANFGASLLGLAQNTIPFVDSALRGFVEGGPFGAFVAVFTDMLGSSEEFQQFIEDFMYALGPLISLIGKALSPILNALVWVITGVVDVLTAIWNFLFGWIPGMRIESRPPRDEDGPVTFTPRPTHSREAPTDGSLVGGGMSTAVQLGVALPLREAADIQLLAAQTQMQAATLLSEAVTLLAEVGVNVNGASPLAAATVRPALTPVVYRGAGAR